MNILNMTNENMEARFLAIEATARELQSQFSELKELVDRALQTPLLKVDALLANRETNGSDEINPSAALASIVSSNPMAKTLLEAAEDNDTKTLLNLLVADADILLRNKQGDTALHLAARKGHKDAVICLVGYKALVNAPGQRMKTPLHCAVEGGNTGIIQRLINAGADKNAKDVDGQTPLMLAATLGNTNVIGCFIMNKIDLNIPDAKGNSAIVYAAKAEQWNAVKYLCEREASVVFRGDEICPLMLATQSGQREVVKSILHYENKPTEELIIKCLARCKNISIVLTFVEEIPNISFATLGGKALTLAASYGYLKSIEALLDAGVYIDSRDERNFTSLHWASFCGHSNCVEIIIKRGAFLDAVGGKGMTPLHSATEGNEEQCVRLLLEAGAKTTIKDSNGKTALDYTMADDICQIFSEFAHRS